MELSKHKEDIESRNHLLTTAYFRWVAEFEAMSYHMGRNQESLDDINSFFEKFCYKVPKEINTFFQKKTGYIITAYKHHVIDRIRHEIRKNRIKTSSIENEELIGHHAEHTHDFEVNELVQKFRNLVSKKFDKDSYLNVFDMMIESHTNQEISLELGLNSVGTKVYRIRKMLKHTMEHT